MTRLMLGFPPAPESQVTLANWRTSPFHRWAFHHVREIVPSADIPNDPASALAFPSAPVDIGTLRIDGDTGRALSLLQGAHEGLEEPGGGHFSRTAASTRGHNSLSRSLTRQHLR